MANGKWKKALASLCRAALWVWLIGLAQCPAATAAARIVGDAPQIDISHDVQLCVTTPDVSLADVVHGACRFALATAAEMVRGYSDQAFWLRLTVQNQTAQRRETILRVGNPRLSRVSLYEQTRPGHWSVVETGFDIPPARRPILISTPALPLTFQAGERKTVYVRVVSRSAINVTPALWMPQDFLASYHHVELLKASMIGAVLAIAAIAGMVFLFWRERGYLYLTLSKVAAAAFAASMSAMLPTYLWPTDLPYDIRLQPVFMCAMNTFYLLFLIRSCEPNYPVFKKYLAALAAMSQIGALWTYAIGYRSGFAIVLCTFLSAMATPIGWLIYVRKRRHYSLWHTSAMLLVFTALLAVTALLVFGNATYRDLPTLPYLFVFLLFTPELMFGLILYDVEMVHRMVTIQTESDARIEFLTRMSHELRTPLDIVIGTAQLLSRTDDPRRLSEGLNDIRNSGRHLLGMVDDILDHTRALSGKLTLAPTPVAWKDFLRRQEWNGRLLAAQNDNRFVLTQTGIAPACVRIDERRLQQILDNLLANAARHTVAGEIALECAVTPLKQDGALRLDFVVRDNGEGIAPAEQARIFLPFERGAASTRKGGKGIGMGLAISRRLTELMGGKMTVESQLGQGARFRFWVTAHRVEAASPTAKRTFPSDYVGRRRTILLVEDQANNRRIVADVLRESRFDVLEADNGNAAMALCRQAPQIDLILTDQFMADGDGWTILQQASAQWPELPVVLLSAAPPDRPATLPAALDFDAHLLKPVDHGELLQCLGDQLGLQWRDDYASPAPLAAPESAIAVPDADLQVLRALIDGGQISEIRVWAKSQAKRAPHLAAFARQVSEAAYALDFPLLARLSGEEAEKQNEIKA